MVVPIIWGIYLLFFPSIQEANPRYPKFIAILEDGYTFSKESFLVSMSVFGCVNPLQRTFSASFQDWIIPNREMMSSSTLGDLVNVGNRCRYDVYDAYRVNDIWYTYIDICMGVT